MKKKPWQKQIPKAILRKGYEKSVSNGFSLVMSAMTLLHDFPQIALGLSQLAQEEIGKSLSILAAFQLKEGDWKWFWSAWLDHNKKSHRAFLYELISPHRIEMRSEAGERFVGFPKRAAMPQEKEAAFYVNYDETKQTFLLPEENVSNVEMLNRTMTASYLAQKAFFIHSALEMSDAEFRYDAFSEIALRVCTEDLYQEDMPAIFEEFRLRSERHAALIEDMAHEIGKEKDFWTEMIARPDSFLSKKETTS
jgi:AbiV family abortive infection protein